MADFSARLAAASWTIDSRRLRHTLDELAAGLRSHPMVLPPDGGALVHDHAEIAASVRHVLARLGAIDLAAAQALSGVMREYRTEQQADRLREAFSLLDQGWRARVERILGKDKAQVVARLVTSAAPDVLRILGKEGDENAHSDLIAWLLTPRNAPVIAPHALRCLAARLGHDSWDASISEAQRTGTISVRREVVIARELGVGDSLARVDILVSGPGFILAIENKVWSREHGDQTRAYWQWMEPMQGLKGGLFLSPSGMAASAKEFQAISYLELVDCLLEGALREPVSSIEEIVLASYLKTIAREIVAVEMRAIERLVRDMEGV